MTRIPKKLQWLFWSANVDDLNPQTHRGYIIHQALAYGRMEEMWWLLKNYSLKDICAVFLNKPSKIYRPERFNFVKNYLLPFRDSDLAVNRYVINTPRDLRP